MKRRENLKVFTLLLAFVMVFTAAIAIWSGGDYAFGARRKNTQYSLSGAKYQLYTNSACTTQAKDIDGNNAILTTDANGNTNTLSMSVGTYYAKEVTPGAGYRLDSQVYTVTVTGGETATFTSAEPPAYGVPTFNVYKFDADGEYGWRRLSGAEFTIKYYDVATKAEIASATPLDTWNFKTKKMPGSVQGSFMAGFDFTSDEPLEGSSPFYVVGGKRVLPIGWFTIQETSAPDGLAINNTIYYGQVKQNGSGGNATVTIEGATSSGDLKVPVSVTDDPQGIAIAINKVSATEVKTSENATLEGAEYEVYYQGSGAKKLVGTLTTDENGITNVLSKDLDGNILKPGVYHVKETKASPGYLLDKYKLKADGTTEEWSGKEEVICTYEENGRTVTKKLEGTFMDGEHVINAGVHTTNIPVFKYTFTSKEPTTDVKFRKANSKTSEAVAGAKLQLQDAHGNVVEEWTSKNGEQHIYGVPSGTYTLVEIEAPLGYDVAEPTQVEVENGQIVSEISLENIPIEIGTIATDQETKSHHGVIGKDETITDTVNIEGLYVNRTYKLVGKLYDKKTGEFLKDKDGKEITAEKEFKAKGTKEKQELHFTIDSSNFDLDAEIVAFETLYRIDPDEEEPVEIAKHEDPKDTEQTVVYGGIAETTAVDGSSGSHNVLGDKGAVIKDTVKYENLSVGTTYTVEGELYDKTTGKLTGIKAKTTFKPEKANGSVVVEFKFDATSFKGHKLVAFETLLVNKIEVSKHEDPEDEDQTVNIPEVETLAVNPACNEHIGNAGKLTIKDTVSYRNLIPGKTYTVKGTLQYRDGLFNRLKTVMNGDTPLTAEATFTPETEDGTVEVTFNFDAVDLKGKTVVVFEDLYDGDYIVATHADPDDEDQSVHIPEIGTKVGERDGEYVIDTIAYKNLIPGKTYKTKGYFVEKATGTAVAGSEGETTFTPTSSSGVIQVKLKPNNSSKALVAFETMYIVTEDKNNPGTLKETEVGNHKDLNDRAQTYNPNGGNGGPATGDTTTIYLLGSIFVLTAALTAVLTIRKRRLQR